MEIDRKNVSLFSMKWTRILQSFKIYLSEDFEKSISKDDFDDSYLEFKVFTEENSMVSESFKQKITDYYFVGNIYKKFIKIYVNTSSFFLINTYIHIFSK